MNKTLHCHVKHKVEQYNDLTKWHIHVSKLAFIKYTTNNTEIEMCNKLTKIFDSNKLCFHQTYILVS